MSEYITSILRDHNGSPSSSRWIALLAFVALCGLLYAGATAEPAHGKTIVELAGYLTWLVAGCVGAGQASSATAAIAGGKTTTATTPPVAPPAPAPPSAATAKTTTAKESAP